MAQEVICELCRAAVDIHASYVVRIDVYADPQVPAMSSDELTAADFDQTFDDLLEEMKQMSAEELQDSVHRRFEYRLCGQCQQRFLANPLGRPRGARSGQN